MAEDENKKDTIDEVTEEELHMPEKKSKGLVQGELEQKAKNSILQKIKETKFAQNIGEKIKGVSSKIIAIVIIIFIAIGLISFLLNAPGLIRGNINQVFQNIGKKIQEFAYGSNTVDLNNAGLSEEKRIELLNYIDEMGIDVVGFGLVAGVEKDSEGKIISYSSDTIFEEQYYTSLLTTIKQNLFPFGTKRDLLYYYLVSNERAYIINDNRTITTGLLPALANILGPNTKGMLNVEGATGVQGAGIEVSVDRENKTLNITRNDPAWGELLNENKFTYSLDGWTGRYGMPVEFSLALHLATMSSGMVEELLTHEDLQTQVNIGLNDTECTVNFKFSITDGNGNKKDINIPLKDTQGNPRRLMNKIKNGETIVNDDISIEGVYWAFSELSLSDYNVIVDYNEEQRGNIGQQYASRYLETIEAILGNNNIAVQVSAPDGRDITNTAVPVFYRKNDSLGNEHITVNSGAYICKYNSDGTPNTNSGKLKSRTVNLSVSNNVVYTKYEKGEVTDNYYEYIFKATDGKGNLISQIDSTSVTEYIPKGDSIKITPAYSSNEIEIVKIQGLNFVKDGVSVSEIIALEKNKEAYIKMLEEIDWFISFAIWANNWDVAEFNYGASENIKKITNSDITDFIENGENFSKVTYYSDMFEDALNSQNVESLMQDLYNKLLEDCQTLKNKSTSMEGAENEINTKLQELGYAGLSKEAITYIYEKLVTNEDVNNEEIKYVNPYIKSVIKHWYKDVSFSNAYKYVTESQTLSYKGFEELDESIEVTTILTPTNGETFIQQSSDSQPYVVKGDLILCDGEVQDKDNVNLGSTGDSDYNWGDGYRATKKILTQGMYYTYDGTEETTTSIMLQQKIEDCNNKLYSFSVKSNRIYTFGEINKDTDIVTVNGQQKTKKDVIKNNGEFTQEFINTEGVKQIDVEDDNILLYQTNVNTLGTDSSVEVKHYLIYVKNNSLKYLSPADGNSYEEVQKRVKTINSVWDALDVICKRVPISFDNTTSDGQVMAQTALSILKNTQTVDAQYIYRDLKEMLIELGYYTEAEFDYLETDVLTWFIPEYTPSRFPQNSIEDGIDIAAIIYPYEEEKQENEDDEETIEEKESLGEIFGLEFDKTQGFESGLKIIAPGDCTILSAKDNTIQIEFDGFSQPEIAVLHGYTMYIEGITLSEEGIISVDENDNEVNISYDDAIKNKTIIKVGDVIGYTGTDVIKIVLKDDKGRYLCNVEDYMAPEVQHINIDNDYIVATVSGENVITDVDTFKMMFEDYQNIVDNVQAFLDMQDKYGVNAVFAACVTIVESSAGTNWAAIPADTYNWFSISGSYNGSSVITNREWCKYNSFAESIEHFGQLISSSSYYFGGGKYTVSEIAISYCDEAWGESVSKYMTQMLEKVSER